jgi:NADP-dependent 3-hydroxy acid dehydrogenase YdfG
MSGVVTAYAFSKASRTANLRGQIIVVPGGSLGLLFARKFACQGCEVIICTRVQEELDHGKGTAREWGVWIFWSTTPERFR